MSKTFSPAKATIALSVIAALAGVLLALVRVDGLALLWQDGTPSVSAPRPDKAALELRSESGDYASEPGHSADTAAPGATSAPIPMTLQASQYQPIAAGDGHKGGARNIGSTETPAEAIFVTNEEAIEQERIQQESLSHHAEADSTDMSSPTAEEEAALKEHEENVQAAVAAVEAMVENAAANNAATDAESH
jgi:hypothetical protein